MARRTKARGDGLYKDPRSPNWQIDKEFAGRRLRRSARTPSYVEAKSQVDTWVERVKRDLLLEQLGEKPKPGAKPEITIDEAATRYFDEIGKGATTADNIDFNLAWIIENLNPADAGRATKLSEVTEPMLLELAARRRAAGNLRPTLKAWRPCAEGSVNRYTLDLVRRLLRRAAITWKASAAVIDWAAVRTPESRTGLFQRELSLAKQKELFARLRPDIRDAVEFLLAVGVRRRGVLEMTWGEVDFDAGVFRVRRKTRQPGEHWQEIPMTARTRALLLTQQDRHPKFVWTFVVHRRRGRLAVGTRRPLTASVLRRQVKGALAAIGLDGFRIHDLRHTNARRTLRTSKDIRTVQRVLGHADIATTAIYADVLQDDVRAALEATDAAYSHRKSPGEPERFTGHEVEDKGKNVA